MQNVKQLAERAATALGCASLTEFVTCLIREQAPVILKQQATIELTNAQFDHFQKICRDQTVAPSEALLSAAKRLDSEGY